MHHRPDTSRHNCTLLKKAQHGHNSSWLRTLRSKGTSQQHLTAATTKTVSHWSVLILVIAPVDSPQEGGTTWLPGNPLGQLWRPVLHPLKLLFCLSQAVVLRLEMSNRAVGLFFVKVSLKKKSPFELLQETDESYGIFSETKRILLPQKAPCLHRFV